jgi:hypothetical protein
MAQSELQSLVDHPNETLAVEYKSWLDLSQNEPRADLARHIAALSNYGGGFIVFGFDDATLQPCGPNPFHVTTFDRDTIAAIVKKYLEPPFQCDVHILRSAGGNEHPVVTVPPHGVVPICSKASGPQDKNGKTVGIVQGVYYIRKPGPESAPILSANEWAPLIRRCAMHDHAAILGAVTAALRAGPPTRAAPDEELRRWHDAAHAAFLRDVSNAKQAVQPIKDAHYQYSYMITDGRGERIDPNTLLDVLREVNGEVRDLVVTGWSMFYIFGKHAIAPQFTVDSNSGEPHDFLECSLLRSPEDTSGKDFWRVSPSGKATIIREYWEDDAGNGQRTFDPLLLARSLAEFVRHARGFAERFPQPINVSFLCEWHGLSGRIVHTPNAHWSPHPPPRDGYRHSTVSAPIGDLTANWPAIVAELGAPVARLFGIGTYFTPEWIGMRSSGWRS